MCKIYQKLPAWLRPILFGDYYTVISETIITILMKPIELVLGVVNLFADYGSEEAEFKPIKFDIDVEQAIEDIIDSILDFDFNFDNDLIPSVISDMFETGKEFVKNCVKQALKVVKEWLYPFISDLIQLLQAVLELIQLLVNLLNLTICLKWAAAKWISEQ